MTDTAPVVISLCPDGPMLVRGDLVLLDADGLEIPRGRSTIALCRCGRTASAPFCDGSHKLLRRVAAASDAAEG
jgi:CDGSH-type Zn-finger protein